MFLVYVFDGLRPELVREELTPNLLRLQQRGTWFERSHCVFPSVTRVNAASLATGSHPSRHGIPGNTLYLRGAGAAPRFGTTGDLAVLRRLRLSEQATLLDVPTAAEVLAAAGRRTVAIGTGSPGSTYLLNPEASRVGGACLHYAFSEPADLLATVEHRLGAPSPTSQDYAVENLAQRVRYATRALLEAVYPLYEPELVYFWCTVPDALHHQFGLGSAEATEGLGRVDAAFGDLLEGLERATGSQPNVIVTADHGYATVDGHIDVQSELHHNGFADGVAARVDGGAAQIFIDDPARVSTERLMAYLTEQPWAAAVFSRHEAAGALPLDAALVGCERAADVIACLTWRHGDNGRGFDGFSLGGGYIAIGAGDHGGASPFELRNTLIAAGPAFRAGVSQLPAGIVDVAPTVCRVLGLQAPGEWTGRTLEEALVEGSKVQPIDDERVRSAPTPSGKVTSAVIAATGRTRYLSQATRVSV